MTNQIRLSKIRISGFRTLSREASFTIDASPGITILVGPNGSGKSTVLDAIEWALTGWASRLPQLTPANAKRSPDIFKTLGSDEMPSVTLTFQEVDTGMLRSIDGGGDLGNVIGLLRRNEAPWSELRSVDAALRWTHFSSQRSVSRLGYEDSDAILKDFAAPAGLERAKVLDRRLWGADTRSALKDLQRETAESIKKHEVALDYLDAVLDAQSGVLDDRPQSTRSLLNELLTEIKEQTGVDLSSKAANPIELETEVLKLRNEAQTKLFAAGDVETKQRDAKSRLRRLEADAEAARQNLNSQSHLHARRAEAASIAQAEVDAVKIELENLQRNARTADSLITARTSLVQVEHELAVARGTLEHAQQTLTEATQTRKLLDAVGALQVRVRAGASIAELLRERATLAEFGDAEAKREEALRQIRELEVQQATLQRQRSEAREVLTAETDRLEALASLSAALRSHLSEHDMNCPVCAAAYGPGELVRRALDVNISAGPATEHVARRASEVSQELGRVSGRLQLAKSTAEAAEQALATQRRIESELERHGRVFIGEWSERRQEDSENELLDLYSRLAIASERETPILASQNGARLRDAEETSALARTQISVLEQSMERLTTTVAGAPGESALRSEASAVAHLLSRALAKVDDLQKELRLATELEEAARSAMISATETLRAAEENFIDQCARLREIDALRVNLFASLSEEQFADLQQRVSVAMSSALERISWLASENRARAASPVSSERLALLRAEYAPDDPGADETSLRNRIQAKLAQSRTTAISLSQLGDRLSARARTWRQIDLRMRGTALMPWNHLFRSIYSSLAGALGETLEWTPDKIDMRMTDVDAHPIPYIEGKPIHGWMAGHFFSEGQLAALQISAMITASILLPWSRWKALLLDDPLQHADVIKVGAFADLVRALSLDKGHQIIMTTHDQEQAEFIKAKFAAANLSAQIIRFERSATRLTKR